MILCERHSTGVKPAVYDLRYAVHFLSAFRTFDRYLIDIWSHWEFRVYIPQPGSSKTRSGDEIHITETIIGVKEPLYPGQLRILKGKIGDNGDVVIKEPEVTTSVTLDWKPGLIFKY